MGKPITVTKTFDLVESINTFRYTTDLRKEL
jgi:hypothetical protein